jgi:hypothetical protein
VESEPAARRKDGTLRVFEAISLALLILPACSDSGANNHGEGTGGYTFVGNGGTGLGSSDTTVRRDSAGNCIIDSDGSGCTGEAFEGESIPLDIYIMFDQSGSMCTCVDPGPSQLCPDPKCAATRLDAVREAARLFMADPASAGIGVGISYFGKQPIGQASCNVADYDDAVVPIGLLPDHASAVNASLQAIQPTGETPTGPAIRGACKVAQAHKTQNSSHEVVILLLTDGKPEAPVSCPQTGTCCPTLSDAVDAASDCHLGSPSIKTYVLGVGPLLGNLAEIADAGGTKEAYLVEGGDVTGEVLSALNAIRGDAIPCQFQIPAPPTGEDIDYGLVNITYASPNCEPTYYYNVANVTGCGTTGGWYYDNATNPEQILLCPTSCDQVAVPGGRLVYTLGCTTRQIPK